MIGGMPLVIVQDGEPVESTRRFERFPIDEVHEAARQQGIDDLAKVKLAVLEPTGRISFIKYDDTDS